MARPTSSPRSRLAAGLPPITAEKIVEAAMELTLAHGIEGWSVRRLADVLGVWPAVIYHHVGDREAVVDAVTNRVIAMIRIPDAGLPWREWFSTLLHEGRAVLRRFPGTARRVVVMGPAVPAALPTIDQGIQALQRAGFGADATLVYRFLLNTAFMLVATEGERGDSPQARERMARLLGDLPDGDLPDGVLPGLTAARTDTLARAGDPRPPEALEFEFFQFTVARALDGAASWLEQLQRR